MKPRVGTVRSLAAPDDGTTTKVSRRRTVACYGRTVCAQHSHSRPEVNPAAMQYVELWLNFFGLERAYGHAAARRARPRPQLLRAALRRADSCAVAIRA